MLLVYKVCMISFNHHDNLGEGDSVAFISQLRKLKVKGSFHVVNDRKEIRMKVS